MKKRYLIALIFSFLFLTNFALQAQSNPSVDRPVQKCIDEQEEQVKVLPKDFSIGFWLGQLIRTCEKLQKTSGTGGGPAVVQILEQEDELDDLIAISDNCDILNEKIKTYFQEMKAIYAEKKEVETYKKNPNNNNTNLFGEEDELSTYSLPRNAAGKIKSLALKVKKELKK